MNEPLHHLSLAERARRRRLPSPAAARAIRMDAGATLQELADELGVHRITVLRWEKGTHRPRGAMAEQYGALLRTLQSLDGVQ